MRMRKSPSTWWPRVWAWGGIGVWCVCLGLPGPAGAAEDPNEQQLEASLRAGEFGTALQAAQRLADVDVRDRWLGRIAQRQAEVGARRASLSTLSDIQGDLARRDALESLAARPLGAAGGAAMADFDTLIELVTSTIAPDTWDEVGGAGAIEPFPTGVYVDASGVLKRLGPPRNSTLLESARQVAVVDSGNRAVRVASELRKVSLVRLEKQLQLRHAFGERPAESMRLLAGLYEIKYLFVYPQNGDIVLAGPAGDWRTDSDGRIVNIETGRPVLQLDDLVVVLRNALTQRGQFGCAIKPRQENLAATKSFVEAWRNRAVKPSLREEWLGDLQATLGHQDIEVWGIDARTRAARVLVEADYRMKLVGMGLEEGSLGVPSYLEEVKRVGGEPPALNVLRWWFTLNYEGIRATAARDAFQLDGSGVKVLSENELLTETGDRIHTGKSDELTSGFARSFTRHFDALADKYPIYAELKNIFDLALIAGVIRSHDIPAQVNWHMTFLADPEGYRIALGPAPKAVTSVVNSVTVNRNRFFAGVSGGVSVDTHALVNVQAVRSDEYGLLDASHAMAMPPADKLPRDAWWWD
ncbi:MAG: DUF1598 domain-containing protein [Pirellulaceae bacterium]